MYFSIPTPELCVLCLSEGSNPDQQGDRLPLPLAIFAVDLRDCYPRAHSEVIIHLKVNLGLKMPNLSRFRKYEEEASQAVSSQLKCHGLPEL